MSEKDNHKERPEVYALRQDGEGWQISRRDFLKAAGIGAAAVGVGMNSRFVRPAYAAEDLETLCKSSPAHQNEITGMMLSPDGKYLLSCDDGDQQKCWNFSTQVLLKSQKSSVSDEKLTAMALIDGKPIALMTKGSSIRLLELPDLKEAGSITVNPGGVKISPINGLAVDSEENIYGISNALIFRLNKGSDLKYSDQEVLYKASSGAATYNDVRILAENRSLLIFQETGFSVYDIKLEKMNSYGKEYSFKAFAVLPGGARALMCQKNGAGINLYALIDGHKIWGFSSDQAVIQAAVTPDGTYGILAGMKDDLILTNLSDGKEIRRITVPDHSADPNIVVAKDGSACAIAIKKSILFISLPDLVITGCPVDLKEMKDDTKGIEVKGTDPVTGQTITYTLPCGSPIPAGAVCVCNCVAGSVCSCDGHTVCTCDKVCSCDTYVAPCSCNSVCTCEGVGPHYWHPN